MTELHRCPDGPHAELVYYDCERRGATRSLHVVRIKQQQDGRKTTHRMSLPFDETLAALARAAKGGVK